MTLKTSKPSSTTVKLLSFLAVFELVALEYLLFGRPAENAMMDFHGIENQPSSSANDDVPMPSQTISAQSTAARYRRFGVLVEC